MHIIHALLAASVAVPGLIAPPPQSAEACALVRITPEGRRIVIDEDDPDHERYRQASHQTNAGPGGARASVSSSGSSRSSVSLSSSSRGGRSVATATTRDGDGERSVTTTHDQNGCTTVIDERPAPRRDR